MIKMNVLILLLVVMCTIVGAYFFRNFFFQTPTQTINQTEEIDSLASQLATIQANIKEEKVEPFELKNQDDAQEQIVQDNERVVAGGTVVRTSPLSQSDSQEENPDSTEESSNPSQQIVPSRDQQLQEPTPPPSDSQIGPSVMQSASFHGKGGHQSSGNAVIYQTVDGPVLRFENFSVTPGPDLFVYLSPDIGIDRSGDLGEFISLGVLKSSAGEQTYALPDNYATYDSVVIWCRAFAVLFAVAEYENTN